MQKIIPWLWFDNNAKEAINFYISVLSKFDKPEDGKISKITKEFTYENSGPDGNSETYCVNFTLAGRDFAAMKAGPYYKFNPAVSLLIACDSVEEADEIWSKLSEDAKVLMEYQKYPFSEKYGWLNDKYGLSWQVYVNPQDKKPKQKVSPVVMFIGKYDGKAEEAINHYTSLFENSKVEGVLKYEEGEGGTVGHVKHAQFILENDVFMAMDGGTVHEFEINGAISFLINCKDQAEVDKFWEKLLEGGAPQACGWLTDKYGVNWQVIPTEMDKYMESEDKEKAQRAMKAMLSMVKIDLNEIKKAYDG